MDIFPVNKMILVEVPEQIEEDETVLVPEGYKPKAPYGTGYVLDMSDDCCGDIEVGDEIVFENTMLQEVRAHGEDIFLLKENFVLCVLSNEREE